MIKRKEAERRTKYGNRTINTNLSLFERNQDIIQNHLNKLTSGYHRAYYIENSVRDCIDEIAHAEGHFSMAPGYEYLSNWSNRASGDYLRLKNTLLEKFKDRYNIVNSINEKRKNKTENKFKILQNKYSTLIQQFLNITERKVSIIDDYGDENWNELPKQTDILISKVTSKEGYPKGWDKWLPEEITLLKAYLVEEFKKYHEKQKHNHRAYKDDEINQMSGIEFETFLSRKLMDLGYKVTGTPTVGDQGADLIAKKNNKTMIIQAKRYSGSVGNKAVQEVVGALNYYRGDQACVITNSIFTSSAKILAQKNNVILIDGHDLYSIENIL